MTPAERLRRKNEFDGSLVHGARAFNLATGRDAHLRRREAAKGNFLDARTGKLRTDVTTPRKCPLCGVDDPQLLFEKDGFPHLRCARCSMIYVSPIVAQDRLKAQYEGESSYTQVLTTTPQIAMDRKRFEYALDVLAEHIETPGPLLDVGCGPGTFLGVARERGWLVQGLEFNARCVQLLREAAIPVIDVPLEAARLSPHSFRCVALWDVLEHITDPRAFLRALHGLLEPRGVLMIEVPQIGSLVSRLLHEKSATFSGDQHINFLTPSTLTQLLESEDFALLELETLVTELGTINNYLSFRDPYLGDASTQIECLTPEFIHANLMGSRLFSLAAPR
jgi:SAM-dependent methyltransferase